MSRLSSSRKLLRLEFCFSSSSSLFRVLSIDSSYAELDSLFVCCSELSSSECWIMQRQMHNTFTSSQLATTRWHYQSQSNQYWMQGKLNVWNYWIIWLEIHLPLLTCALCKTNKMYNRFSFVELRPIVIDFEFDDVESNRTLGRIIDCKQEMRERNIVVTAPRSPRSIDKNNNNKPNLYFMTWRWTAYIWFVLCFDSI